MPEHVRSDDVPFVLGEHVSFRTFAGIDVEVVEPEIRQHFLKLPFAIRSAHDLLHGELDQRLVGSLLVRVRPFHAL